MPPPVVFVKQNEKVHALTRKWALGFETATAVAHPSKTASETKISLLDAFTVVGQSDDTTRVSAERKAKTMK
jgi:hypothetical protein